MPNKVCFHVTTKATAEPTTAHEFEWTCVCVRESGEQCCMCLSVASWTSVRQQCVRREIVRRCRKNGRGKKQYGVAETNVSSWSAWHERNANRINVSVPVSLMAGNGVDGLASADFIKRKNLLFSQNSHSTHSNSFRRWHLFWAIVWFDALDDFFRCVNAVAVNFFFFGKKILFITEISQTKFFYRFFSHATKFFYRTIFRMK